MAQVLAPLIKKRGKQAMCSLHISCLYTSILDAWPLRLSCNFPQVPAMRPLKPTFFWPGNGIFYRKLHFSVAYMCSGQVGWARLEFWGGSPPSLPAFGGPLCVPIPFQSKAPSTPTSLYGVALSIKIRPKLIKKRPPNRSKSDQKRKILRVEGPVPPRSSFQPLEPKIQRIQPSPSLRDRPAPPKSQNHSHSDWNRSKIAERQWNRN